MRFSKAWTIAAKDIKVFLRKRSTLYSVVLLPLIVGIALPIVTRFAGGRHGGIPGARMPTLLNAFSFFFLILAAELPVAIASYTLVGEKVEKSLEPLLAAPITDGELLLGKGIAAFIPPIGAIYVSAIIFMALTDALTHGILGYSYFPNSTILVILLLVAPLAAILSVETSVIISSRATDVRAAQLQGVLIVIPFAAIYVATEIGQIKLDVPVLLIISGIVLAADLVLLPVSRKTFQREQILTKWT